LAWSLWCLLPCFDQSDSGSGELCRIWKADDNSCDSIFPIFYRLKGSTWWALISWSKGKSPTTDELKSIWFHQGLLPPAWSAYPFFFSFFPVWSSFCRRSACLLSSRRKPVSNLSLSFAALNRDLFCPEHCRVLADEKHQPIWTLSF